MTLLSVVENDTLDARHHAIRAQWIAWTLECAALVMDTKQQLPDESDFNRKTESFGFNKSDCTALLWIASNIKVARMNMEQTNSRSWREIFQNRPRSRSRKILAPALGVVPDIPTPLQEEAHAAPPFPVPSVPVDIPTPIQETPPPPAVQPSRRDGPRAVDLKGLTREQVDPDFDGTPLEFATKYGHVNLLTKKEIDADKREEALMKWVGAVSEYERAVRQADSAGQAMKAAWADVDPATLQEWLAKPGKAKKLQGWRNNAQVACENLQKVTFPHLPGREGTTNVTTETELEEQRRRGGQRA